MCRWKIDRTNRLLDGRMDELLIYMRNKSDYKICTSHYITLILINRIVN